MNSKARAIAAALVVLVCVSPAAAIPREWTGSTSNDWYTTSNWSPAGAPDCIDHLVVLSGSPTTTLDVTADKGGSITFDGAATLGTFTGGGSISTSATRPAGASTSSTAQICRHGISSSATTAVPSARRR